MLAQKRGLQFYQTRSHAIVLYNTLLAICIEKAVCMNTKEEPYHKVYQSPWLPRVVLKPNLQSGQQDQPDQDARKSSDHQSASDRTYGETCSGNVDFWIPGILHSTVQQQDTNRKESVKKLIQQSENHPNKECFLQDLNKTRKISKFSEESKKLITDMGNTEIFELSETLSKKQCPDCALYWRIGIVYCSCRRCPTPSQSAEEYDALSIPGYVLKKNLHCGAKHGATATNVLQSQGHVAESSPTQAWWVQNHLGKMTQRWQIPESLSNIGWTEERIIQCDELALEDHSYIATRGERNRNEKSWVLKLNKEGAQGPMNQRPDFFEAKREI